MVTRPLKGKYRFTGTSCCMYNSFMPTLVENNEQSFTGPLLYHNNTSNMKCYLNNNNNNNDWVHFFQINIKEFDDALDSNDLFNMFSLNKDLKEQYNSYFENKIRMNYPNVFLKENVKIKLLDKKLIISTSKLDISNYSDLKILQKFYLKDLLFLHINQVKQISYLSQLSNLRKIRFGDNFNQKIDVLSSLEVLESIQFGDKFDQNIDSLSSLINLKLLILGRNFNKNINSLSSLINLKHLFLGYNFNQNTDVLLGLQYLELVLFEKKFVTKDVYVDFRDFISNNYDNDNYKNSCLNKFNQIFKGINSYYPLSSSFLAFHDNADNLNIIKILKLHANYYGKKIIKRRIVNSEYNFKFHDFYNSIYTLKNDLDFFSKYTLYESKNELELIIDSLSFTNLVNSKVLTKLPITKLSFKLELGISQLIEVLDRCDVTKLKILDLNNIEYLNDYIPFPNIFRYLKLIEYIELMINLEKLDLGKFQVKNYIIHCLSKLENLKTLRFVGYITNDGFSYLSNLINLKELHYEGNKSTSNAFLHLSKLINLEVLSIKNSTINTGIDTGIDNLSKLTKLTALNLENCLFSLRYLYLYYSSDLTNLTKLNLSQCNFLTDAELIPLKKFTNFKNIEKLYLSQCDKITDTGLFFLRDSINLEILDISHCNLITDQGLKHLSKLTNLKILDISHCNLITDKGLKHLSKLTNLYIKNF